MPPPRTDAQLAAAARAGDLQAFADLYERHAAVAHRTAAHWLPHAQAEDAVQDAFLAAWRNLASFDPERASFRAWLLTIVGNRSRDAWRRVHADQRRQAAATAAVRTQPHSPPADEVTLRNEAAQLVRTALGRLQPPQATALAMAYGGGLSASEIADRTGTSLGTAKGRLRLGLEAMRRTPLAGLRPQA